MYKIKLKFAISKVNILGWQIHNETMLHFTMFEEIIENIAVKYIIQSNLLSILT